MTFPVTYLKVVLPRLPPLQSTVVAPQTKHLQDVQRVRMASEALPFVVPLPDCLRVQAAFCAGLLHLEGADRVISLPSIKYGLEVVLPTLAEIPQSQALLKEGALLQPAEELVQVTGKWIQTRCFHFICTSIRFLQCRLMVLLCKLSLQKESVQSRQIGGGYCIGINA